MEIKEKALVRTESSFWALQNGSWSQVFNFFFAPAAWKAKSDGATCFKVIKTRYYSDKSIETEEFNEVPTIDLEKVPWAWSIVAEPKGEKIASMEELYFLKGQIATADVQPVSLYFNEAMTAARNIWDVIGFQVVDKDYYYSGESIPRKLRYIFFQEPVGLEEVKGADWLPQRAKDYLQAEMSDFKFIHCPKEGILYPFRGEYMIISKGLNFE